MDFFQNKLSADSTENAELSTSHKCLLTVLSQLTVQAKGALTHCQVPVMLFAIRYSYSTAISNCIRGQITWASVFSLVGSHRISSFASWTLLKLVASSMFLVAHGIWRWHFQL